MELSAGYLQRCAADTGFSVATLEKVSRLGEVADNIARHPFLREKLLLKGWDCSQSWLWPSIQIVGGS